MNVTKYLLPYVKKTLHLGLRLGPFIDKDLNLILDSNMDWAGYLDTRKSTGEYVYVLTTGKERSPGRSLHGQQYHGRVKDNRLLCYPLLKPNIWLLPKW